MLQTARSYGGMVTAPHHLAAQAGLRVLNDGGNAIEAMIAAASTIAVVYPHMNALGGDNFWLIASPDTAPIGIDACGAAAGLADIGFYKSQDFEQIPSRGPLSALTVAGAVSGWAEAFEYSRQCWDGRLPVSRLLEDAIYHAENGVAVTETLSRNSRTKLEELQNVVGFAETFLKDGHANAEGERLVLPRLAATLDQLAHDGFHDFYRGDLAASMAADLERSAVLCGATIWNAMQLGALTRLASMWPGTPFTTCRRRLRGWPLSCFSACSRSWMSRQQTM